MKPSEPITEDLLSEEPSEPEDDALRQLCHEISGPLTSILVHCDLQLESDCTPATRARIEAILSEALRIHQRLRNSQRG